MKGFTDRGETFDGLNGRRFETRARNVEDRERRKGNIKNACPDSDKVDEVQSAETVRCDQEGLKMTKWRGRSIMDVGREE